MQVISVYQSLVVLSWRILFRVHKAVFSDKCNLNLRNNHILKFPPPPLLIPPCRNLSVKCGQSQFHLVDTCILSPIVVLAPYSPFAEEPPQPYSRMTLNHLATSNSASLPYTALFHDCSPALSALTCCASLLAENQAETIQ